LTELSDDCEQKVVKLVEDLKRLLNRTTLSANSVDPIELQLLFHFEFVDCGIRKGE
jgi:hypothetical protein